VLAAGIFGGTPAAPAASGNLFTLGRYGGSMDEGLPIAYEVLEKNVPVYASGGELVGSVDHVIAAVQQDIFHGIVIKTSSGKRFVAAEDVDSLHEHGVDLKLDEAQAAALPEPHGAAPTYRDDEPGTKPNAWTHFLHTMVGRSDKPFKEE